MKINKYLSVGKSQRITFHFGQWKAMSTFYGKTLMEAKEIVVGPFYFVLRRYPNSYAVYSNPQ